MNCKAEAPRFSVYLGAGVYVGGVFDAGHDCGDMVAIRAFDSFRDLMLTRESDAANYVRAGAVRVCHFARRSGLKAWLVSAPAAAA